MLGNGKPDEASSSQMLTVVEVAYLLQVHPNTIRHWCKIGVLKAYRIGRRGNYRFSKPHIETFLGKDDGHLKYPDSSASERGVERFTETS